MKISTRFLTALAILFTLGCSDATDSTDTDVTECTGGKCDSAEDFAVIPGGVWTACEASPAEETGTLIDCSFFAEGEIFAPINVFVEAKDLDGVIVAQGFQTVTGERDFLATIEDDRYPVDLRVAVNFDDDHPVEGFSALELNKTVRVESAAQLTDNPIIFEQPFDLWPVQIATDQTLMFFEATVDLDEPYTRRDGTPSTLTLRPSVFTRDVTSALIAVPRGAQVLSGELKVGDALTESAAMFQGPGRYVVDSNGLRPATNGDAALFGDAVSPLPTDPTEPTDPTDPTDPEPTEPACETNYLTWLDGFESSISSAADATGALADLDCKQKTPEAYAGWHALFTKTLDEFSPIERGFLSEDELETLELILEARPEATDAASYILWHGFYETRFLGYVGFERGFLSEDEDAALTIVERARPLAEGDEAYSVWFDSHQARLLAYIPTERGFLSEDEAGFLNRSLESRPASSALASYATWFESYENYLDAVASTDRGFLSDDEAKHLQTVRLSKPEAVSVDAYKVWLTTLVDRVQAAGSFVSDDEKKILAELTNAQPDCVDNESAAEAAIAEERDMLERDQEIFVELAAVQACGS